MHFWKQQPSISTSRHQRSPESLPGILFPVHRRPPERQTFLRSIAADVFRRSYTAAYFIDGEMAGGFCLVLEPPLVELELLPRRFVTAILFLSGSASAT